MVGGCRLMVGHRIHGGFLRERLRATLTLNHPHEFGTGGRSGFVLRQSGFLSEQRLGRFDKCLRLTLAGTDKVIDFASKPIKIELEPAGRRLWCALVTPTAKFASCCSSVVCGFGNGRT